jgi:hypothetical protein
LSHGPSGPSPTPPQQHASLEDELFAAYLARAGISGAALDAVLADNGLQAEEDEHGAAIEEAGRGQREQQRADRGRARHGSTRQGRRSPAPHTRVGVDPAYAGPRVALGYDSFMLLHEEAARPRLQLHLPGVSLPRAPAIPHPERPDRLRAVAQHLVACGLWQRCARVPTRCCSRAELAGVHTAAYLDQLEGLEGLLKASGGELHFGTDTFVNAYTLKAAKIAAGATIAVTEDVVFGRADRGLALVRCSSACASSSSSSSRGGSGSGCTALRQCRSCVPVGGWYGVCWWLACQLPVVVCLSCRSVLLAYAIQLSSAHPSALPSPPLSPHLLVQVRPPGHHAEADQAMGFCFYNNVAAAAWVATRLWGLQRVLVLDWDVHHGACVCCGGSW